jgi:hypothetical protein
MRRPTGPVRLPDKAARLPDKDVRMIMHDRHSPADCPAPLSASIGCLDAIFRFIASHL